MKNILIKDGVILFLGTCLNMIIMLLMQVILARNLDLDEYGAIISALNLINFLALFISLGASEYILKSFGRYGKSAYKIVQMWIKLLPISIIILLLLVIVIFTSDIFGELTSKFLLLIIPNIILQGLLPLTLSIYQIEGNYKKIVVINLVLYSTRLLASTIALLYENSIYLIGYMLNMLSIVGLLYFFIHLRRYFIKDLIIPSGKFENLNEEGLLIETVKGIAPYALLAFFYYGFYQSNIIFINIFLTESAVGIYNAAFTVISLTFILPTIVLSQLFNPKLHFWVKNDTEKVITLFKKGSKWLFLLGILIATVLLLIDEYVIKLLFGPTFNEAVKILTLLLFIVPVRYIQSVSDAIMNTENQINIKMRIFFIVFIINILLNVMIIPKMGLNGVVLTTLISEIVLLILTFSFCWRFIKEKVNLNGKL